MDKVRFNEILGKLLEKDNSIETTDMLNELKTHFESFEKSEDKIKELEDNYKALEQKYIDTFKNTLTDSKTEEQSKEETQEKTELNIATFDDIFKTE